MSFKRHSQPWLRFSSSIGSGMFRFIEGYSPVRHSTDPPDLIRASLIVENRSSCCLDSSLRRDGISDNPIDDVPKFTTGPCHAQGTDRASRLQTSGRGRSLLAQAVPLPERFA